ncbi:hypothetical protein D5018_06700 [Parashewanella curva]|uniref:Uncharacterized protein n=1 Tax=Parashewanella curva TaxID=2338552 RepID=A0A3L8PYH5_9GAMM|nr:hypothetical protein [Parashewanella curva]RLV60476.1 hypothetical protein D5018_06700 [Parashewanella curva]
MAHAISANGIPPPLDLTLDNYLTLDNQIVCDKFAQFKNEITTAFSYEALGLTWRLISANLVDHSLGTKIISQNGVSGLEKVEIVFDALMQHLAFCYSPIESVKKIAATMEETNPTGSYIAIRMRTEFQLQPPSTKPLPPSKAVTKFHTPESSQSSQERELATKLEAFSITTETTEIATSTELGTQSMRELEEALNNASQSQIKTAWRKSFAELQLLIAENPIPIAESMLSEELISESDLSEIKTRTNCADTERANTLLMLLNTLINLSCVPKDYKINVVIKLISACLQHKKTDKKPVELFLSKLK